MAKHEEYRQCNEPIKSRSEHDTDTKRGKTCANGFRISADWSWMTLARGFEASRERNTKKANTNYFRH